MDGDVASTSGSGTAVPQLKAVVFDVDGTLADTERDGHRPAFTAAFAEHGVAVEWSPEEYGRLLAVTGGRRRVAAYLRERGVGPEADDLAATVHRTKSAVFRDQVLRGAVTARPGVVELVAELVHAGILIGVATTGRRSWVEPLLARLLGRGTAAVVVTGDEVERLKPDPEAYARAVRELAVNPAEVLAVEDSAIGLRAALAAGLATVAVTNGYTTGQDFSGAVAVLPAFDGARPLTMELCRALHAQHWTERRSG